MFQEPRVVASISFRSFRNHVYPASINIETKSFQEPVTSEQETGIKGTAICRIRTVVGPPARICQNHFKSFAEKDENTSVGVTPGHTFHEIMLVFRPTFIWSMTVAKVWSISADFDHASSPAASLKQLTLSFRDEKESLQFCLLLFRWRSS